ncbi:plasmid partition family protein [Borreliella afzelii]
MLNEDIYSVPKDINKSISIGILVKYKELYDFCKQDSTRLYFILC